jgi:hypothetical protein
VAEAVVVNVHARKSCSSWGGRPARTR